MSRWRARVAATLAAPLLVASSALVGAAAAPTPAAAQDAEALPSFEFAEQLFDHDTLDYNPTGEFIFPSLFHAGEHLSDPLAEWYLYYAPHENPGGIALAYADSLDGPWTEHAANPLIENEWQPHYDEVTHISSPDAFWHPEEEQVFLYFHGENTTTRYATSTDGVTFDYGGVAVTAADSGEGVTEASYARVFPHPDPSADAAYAMFYMDNRQGTRHIRLATSDDARSWQVDPEPLVTPGGAEGANVSSADLWTWQGQHYVIYHASSGNIHARTVDPALTEVGPSQILHTPTSTPPDSGRSAAPQIAAEDGTLHLFYEAGSRLNATIAHAVQTDPGQGPDDPVYASCPGAGSDEFDEPELDRSLWTRIVREEQSQHELVDGALELPTYLAGVNGAPLIQQQVPEVPWEATVAVSVDPTASYHQAGLLLHADDANYAKVDLLYGSNGLTVEFIHRQGGSDRNTAADSFPAPEELGDTVWFRIADDGEWVTAAMSVDGETFTPLGRPIAADDLGADHIGPYAMQGATGAEQITASFDWFRFSPTEAELEACLDDGSDDDDGSGGGSGDEGAGAGGGLPNTGSPVLILLIGAGVLLATGTVIVVATGLRRRRFRLPG